MAKRLTEKQVLLAKVGGTPDATNVVDLDGVFIPSLSGKTGEYKQLDGGMGGTKGYTVDDYLSVSGTLSCNLRGNGGGATLPKLSDMLKMCGLDESLVDSDSDGTNDTVVYTPNDTEIANGSVLFYLDGEKREFSGVSANLKLDFEVGTIAKTSFDISGFSSLSSAEDNPAVTLDSNDVFIVKSISAVTLSGGTLNLKKASFDMGNQMQEIYAISQKEFYRSDYKPTITLEDNAIKGDTSHWDDFLNGNLKSISILLTSKSGNTFTFTADNCRYTEVSESDDSGKVGLSRKFSLEKNGVTPNFSIAYA